MSRGFVKEDDQEEAPIIPKRAPLPANTPNYVTEFGLQLLKEEMEALVNEKKNIDEANETEKRRTLTVLNGRLSLLEERIQSAQLVETENKIPLEIRFGSTLKYKVISGKQKGVERTFQIVGVDEANIKKQKIAFTAPIVRSLMGLKIGEKIEFALGGQLQTLEVTDIEYV